MKSQREMFWDAHKKVTYDILCKNLALAQKSRFEAVKLWRSQTCGDESKFDAYVESADKAILIAEQNIDAFLAR